MFQHLYYGQPLLVSFVNVQFTLVKVAYLNPFTDHSLFAYNHFLLQIV